MSLATDKASLFGSKKQVPPLNKPEARSIGSAIPTPPADRPRISTYTSNLMHISKEARAKKTEEAREWSNKGTKHLKTSMLQWNPDYLAAGSCFENAANVYRSIGELSLARSMMAACADCNEKIGSTAAAAVSYVKCANLAQAEQKKEDAAMLFQQASELFGVSGDLEKCGEMLAKAAKELESVKPEESVRLYNKALNYMCPPETAKDLIKNVHPKMLDVIRESFSFHLRTNRLAEALQLAERMVDIFEAFESESSALKTMASITIIQLALGDVVRADKTFVEDHLSRSKAYLQSKESALAENFLMAMKNHDVDQLDAARNSHDLNYLDKEVQRIAKGLSIFGDARDDDYDQSVTISSSDVSGIKTKKKEAWGAVQQHQPAVHDTVTNNNNNNKKKIPKYEEDEDEINLR